MATTMYITSVSLALLITNLYSTYLTINSYAIKNVNLHFISLALFFSIRKTSMTRNPHSEFTKSVSKRNRKNDENEEYDEAFDLLLNLQDSSVPATGVSEYERGWVVNNMTKKTDEKRKKEIAERKAATTLDSNTSVDASNNGKQAKYKKKDKRDCVPKKAMKP
jgi:hypothetical protein